MSNDSNAPSDYFWRVPPGDAKKGWKELAKNHQCSLLTCATPSIWKGGSSVKSSPCGALTGRRSALTPSSGLAKTIMSKHCCPSHILCEFGTDLPLVFALPPGQLMARHPGGPRRTTLMSLSDSPLVT
jgi:hypothetical protein